MNLIVYNKAHEKAGLIDQLEDLKIESTLIDGDKVLSFFIPKNSINTGLLENEGYLRTTTDEFVIKEINKSNNGVDIIAVLNLEDLEGHAWDRFNSQEATIESALNLALAGTGWAIGTNTIGTKHRTIAKTYCNGLEVLKEICKIYLAEIKYDTINKTVSVYSCIGANKGEYLMDTVNAKKIDSKSDSYDFYTKLIAIGATTTTTTGEGDNATTTSNTLTCTVTNNTYSTKVKTVYWKDERYTVLASLQEDAQAKLDELAKPKVSYSVDIAKLGANTCIGDKLWLISKDKKIREELRIVKLVEYPNNPSKNTCELGNRIYTFEDMQNANRQTTQTVDNITTGDNGYISPSALGDALDKVVLAQLDVASLQALSGRIGVIESSYITTTELNTAKATIEDAVITNLQADNVFASYGEFDILNTNVANINTLLGGTVTTGSTQTIVLNSLNATVENEFIKNAMIKSVSADKINAGTINTNLVNIASSDGTISIADNTMQFKDSNGNVRIQIGQDTEDNFNFIVKAEDGTTTLIDGTGVKENAIANKLIKTKMINDNAITGDKIDYESFVSGFNASTNTNTINSSKILVDGTEQSLYVAFNTLQSTVDNIDASGRNWVRNGDFTQDTTNWSINKNSSTTSSITVETSTVKGWNYVTFASTVSDGGWAWLYNTNETLKYELGKKYTISFFANANNTATTLTIRVNSASGDYTILANATKNISTEWALYTITFTNNKGNGLASNYPLQFGVASGGSVNIAQIKLEKGENASSYCQAYEDISKVLKTNSTSITTMQGQISTLITECEQITDNTGNIESLSTQYSSLNQTLTSLSSTVSSHTTSIGDISSTVSDHTSSIQQLNNSITTKVWSNDITTSINALQIGGANLIINGNFKRDCFNWYINMDANSSAWCGKVIDDTDILHPNRMHTTINSISSGGWVWFNLYQTNFDFVSGKKYTLSFLAKSGTLSTLKFRVCKNDSTIVQLNTVNFNIGTEWTKCTITFTAQYNASISNTRLQFTHAIGTVKYTDIKLEEGDKATTFSVAQEDIDSTIDTTNSRVSSVEQQITSTAITTTISTGLAGTDKIETTKFTMDNEGLTIKNGGIEILNNANTTVMSCDNNGDLLLRGTFTNYDATTGYIACKIEDTQVKFYNYKENGEYLGSLASVVNVDDISKAGISLLHGENSYFSIAYKNDGSYKPYVEFDNFGEANASNTGFVSFYSPVKFNKFITNYGIVTNKDNTFIEKDTYVKYGSKFNFQYSINDGGVQGQSGAIGTDANNNLYVCGNGTNYLKLGNNISGTNYNALTIHRQDDVEYVDVYGNFYVYGNKNCVQTTEKYGNRLFYSVEDAASYLTTRVDKLIKVEDNKQIKIEFDDIFKECVNLTNYQICINKESYGDYRILEKTKDYFILEATERDFKFTYTIVAKRKGYEDKYLDVPYT